MQALVSGYLPGRAKATQEVDLAFRISGPLIEFPVKLGDKVQAGDIVARIDPRSFQFEFRRAEADLNAAKAELRAMEVGARPEELEQLRAALQRAEANFRTATSDLARVTPLKEQGVISESDYDQYVVAKERADAELRQAREDLRIGESGARKEDLEAKRAQIASLEAARALAEDQWRYTYLRAPFAGTIVAKYVENFEDVRAKEPIVRIVDATQIEMVVNVPEGSISLVPYVTDITCTFDAFPDTPLPAEVKEVGVEASQSTRTYPVTLIMQQREGMEILPGMAGRVRGRVVTPTDEGSVGVEVPESAVFERDGKRYVWVIQSSDGKTGTTELREVQVDRLTPRGLRLTDGLEPQEWIATAGVAYLEPGQRVRLLDAAVEGAAL